MAYSSQQFSSKLLEIFLSPSPRNRRMWFVLSLAIAALYGVWAMQQAFAGEYVVQDDARQHVFWLQRFVDPDLFSNDLIADYFQGVAPLGYSWLYRIVANLGIQPTVFSKILPFFLGLITTSYCYWIVWELFPVPLAGFVSTVSFSQSIWYSSEHASGTPRAFLYPLLLAFIYYLIRDRPWLSLLSLTLQALFYPQIALVGLGVLALRLIVWQKQRLSWATDRKSYLQFAVGFCLVGGILLYAKAQADFGEVISRAEAIALPEFQSGGRNSFFGSGLDFWLNGRSGLFHERGFTPATIIPGFALPLWLWLPIKSPLRERVSPQIWVLVQVLIVSLGLFLLAHLLLFQLHLPSRYTSHTFRAIVGITCGISWLILLDDLAKFVASMGLKFTHPDATHFSHRLHQTTSKILAGLSVVLAVFVVFYPVGFFDQFPKVGYYDFSARHKLYEYFAAQPKDSVIASLSVEASNLPIFSERTVLVSPEHAIAYHKGYYRQFRQRAEDLIQAQYTDEPELLAKVISTYGIDFWLLDQTAFEPSYIRQNSWLRQYQPMANAAIKQLEAGKQTLLQQAMPLCAIARGENWTILAGDCVSTFAEKLSDRPPKPGSP